MGNINAKIEKEREGEHIGPRGIGTRNERGDRTSSNSTQRD